MAQKLLESSDLDMSQVELVQNILVASNLVMSNAHDFLDLSLIEKGVFIP